MMTANLLTPSKSAANKGFSVTKQKDPNKVIIKLRQIVEFHLEAKYFNDPRTGITEQLTNKLFKYDQTLEALPLSFSPKNIKPMGAVRIINDSPQLHVPIMVPLVVFKPRLGAKLEAVVTHQSDFEGIRLLLELNFAGNNGENACHNVNVMIPRDRVGKVCLWEASASCFARAKSKYQHVPERIRIGAKLAFWLIGHTCDPDGGNYALHGTLSEKDLKKILKK